MVFVIVVLGGTWGVLDNGAFKGLFGFLIDGGLILLFTVILGNLTNVFLKRVGVNILDKKQEEEYHILDVELESVDVKQSEEQKDKASLIYGVIWSLFLLL